MTTSPDFTADPADQTASRPATPHNSETNGYHRFVNVKQRGAERHRPPPNSPHGYLRELPALILLDRLPTPVLATGLDGVLIYTNPAFATMLGHPDTTALSGQQLAALLARHSETEPRDCVAALRGAGTVVVDWLHADGFSVRTLVSDALLVRATDPILLISITDISEVMWSTSTLFGAG
jgi:PAS domain-containing protein